MWLKDPRYSELCTLIGIHLVVATSSMTWYYGNLSTYMNSYYNFRCYPECLDGDSQWILNIFLVLVGVGLFLFEFTQRLLGLRWTFVLTIFTHNAALLLTAWAVQVSVIATCIFMGVIFGAATGMLINVGFKYLHLLPSKHTDTYMVTVMAGGCLLNAIQNPIITQFVNPSNLKPDGRAGRLLLFSQTEVLDRVPTVIILLASMNLTLQLVGFFLMSISTPAKSQSDSPPVSQNNGVGKEHAGKDKEAKSLYSYNGDSNSILKHFETQHSGLNKATIIESNNYGSNDQAHSDVSLKPIDEFIDMPKIKQNGKEDAPNHRSITVIDEITSETRKTPFSPSEAIRTARFWSLWLYGASSGLNCSLISSYYKEFGLLYIHDDQHLTILGSIMPVLAGTCGVMLGCLIKNKLVHVGDCLVLSLALNSWACALCFFAARLNEPTYIMVILVLSFSQSLFYFVLTNGTFEDFGSEHFATIFSMAFTGRPIASFLSALYLTPLLKAVGWFWVFMTCGFVSLIALAFKVLSSSILFRDISK